MVSRSAFLVREDEPTFGRSLTTQQDLIDALGHEDDALVPDLRPPKADCSLLKIDLRPFQATNFPAAGTGVEKDHNEVEKVLKGGLHVGRPGFVAGQAV